jgi:hypothetical protein
MENHEESRGCTRMTRKKRGILHFERGSPIHRNPRDPRHPLFVVRAERLIGLRRQSADCREAAQE